MRLNRTFGLLPLLLVLFAQAGRAAEPDSTASVQLPLPDGTVVYVRYGEPGGVLLTSRTMTREGFGPDDLAAEAATDSTMSLLRRLLREELAAMRATAPAATPAAGTYAAPTGYPAGYPAGGAYPTDYRSAAGPDVVRVGGTVPPAGTKARTPDTAAPAGGGADMTTATVVSVPIGELQELRPEVIRERLLDTGLFRTSQVLFVTDKAELSSRSQEVLDIIGGILREHPELSISVEGHADTRGPELYNLDLSRRRAASVASYLSGSCGIEPSRINTVGYGESRPLAAGTSATDLAVNRRVEFRVVGQGPDDSTSSP